MQQQETGSAGLLRVQLGERDLGTFAEVTYPDTVGQSVHGCACDPMAHGTSTWFIDRGAGTHALPPTDLCHRRFETIKSIWCLGANLAVRPDDNSIPSPTPAESTLCENLLTDVNGQRCRAARCNALNE